MSETIIIIIGCTLVILCMYDAFSEGVDRSHKEEQTQKELYDRIDKLEKALKEKLHSSPDDDSETNKEVH